MELKSATTTVSEVADVLATILGVERRHLQDSTPLFGSLPELDSLSVVEVVAALEERFGVTIDEEDVTAEVFATLSSLAALVDAKRR